MVTKSNEHIWQECASSYSPSPPVLLASSSATPLSEHCDSRSCQHQTCVLSMDTLTGAAVRQHGSHQSVVYTPLVSVSTFVPSETLTRFILLYPEWPPGSAHFPCFTPANQTRSFKTAFRRWFCLHLPIQQQTILSDGKVSQYLGAGKAAFVCGSCTCRLNRIDTIRQKYEAVKEDFEAQKRQILALWWAQAQPQPCPQRVSCDSASQSNSSTENLAVWTQIWRWLAERIRVLWGKTNDLGQCLNLWFSALPRECICGVYSYLYLWYCSIRIPSHKSWLSSPQLVSSGHQVSPMWIALFHCGSNKSCHLEPCALSTLSVFTTTSKQQAMISWAHCFS